MYHVLMVAKGFLLVLLCNVLPLSGFSQKTSAHAWIDPDRVYYKIPVVNNGIHRVYFESLVKAGLSSETVPADGLAVLNFGREIPIFVSATLFGPGEYIEFYGQKNTIGLDTFLYADWRKDLFNTEFSLVNDTNAYFLTIDPGKEHRRLSPGDTSSIAATSEKVAWCWKESKKVFSETYFKNKYGDIIYSQFEPSEGFGSGLRSLSLVDLVCPGAYKAGPSPIVTFRTGQLSIQSILEIKWNNTLLASQTLPPSKTAAFTFEPGWADWSETNTLSLKNTNNINDKHTLAFVNVKYPSQTDAENQTQIQCWIPEMSTKARLEINSLQSPSGKIVLVDLTENKRWILDKNATQIVLEPLAAQRQIIAIDEASAYIPQEITQFIPKPFTFTGQTFVIITSSRLRNQAATDPAEAYANYRKSVEGGGHNTQVINIEDIYNHFGYGIHRHFASIKNLAAFMKTNWPTVASVLLLGKAVEYPFVRQPQDVSTQLYSSFFIPTYGYLGSDNMLFSEGNYPDPFFAVGRVAARNGQEILDYLDKVKQYESAQFSEQTIEASYWKKKVLHLGGGKNADEQAAIRFGLESMESVIKDTIFGGDVSKFYKRSGEEIQFTVNEEINGLFNGGLAIINFFGHSASSSWDFSIENPRNYSNTGRYPMIHSFGCYSGNLHGTARGISEAFVLEKNKGSISFLATSGTAFIPSLSFFGKQLHDLMLNTRRYISEGEAIRILANKNRTARLADLALYSQITLHGDPTIRPYMRNEADLTWDEKNIKTSPEPILAAAPSFSVKVPLYNLGAFGNDSVSVTLIRLLPSGKKSDTLHLKIGPVANKTSIDAVFPTYGSEGVGKNTLFAIADTDNTILEGPLPDAENNNLLAFGDGFDFFITDNLARPVFPPDYGIIGNPSEWLLRASTTSVPIEKTTYVFQIDTSRYFSSPLFESGKVVSDGGLIDYVPLQKPLDNKVYYWRISPDSTMNEGFRWANASFIYLPGEAGGWNQSHFFQYLQNPASTLDLSEETDRKFEMGKNYNIAKFRNKTWDVNDKPGFTFNNITFASVTPWLYLEGGVAFVRYNEKTGQFYRNAVGGEYGSINPTSNSIAVYPFRTSTAEERKKAIDFAENVIQTGEFVTFFTIIRDTASRFYPEEWASDEQLYGKSLFTVMEKAGASYIRQLEKTGSVPYFLQYFKHPTKGKVLQEALASADTEIIENASVYTNFKSAGAMTSPAIGPAISWDNISVNWENKQPESTSRVYIYGIDKTGNATLTDSILGSGQRKPTIDASQYPYIRLEANTADSVQKEAGQLLFWRTSFPSLPDLAIRHLRMQPDPFTETVQQGQAIQLDFDIVNTGSTDIDSFTLTTSYTGPGKELITIQKRIPGLAAGAKSKEELICTAPTGNVTTMTITAEVNPTDAPAERYRFNNQWSRSFPLLQDKKNPFLQVYFDGLQILNGDIVSPKPEIMMVLRDDNVHRPITSPSVFEIKLDTGRNQFVEIPANSPDLEFIPATKGQGEARMMYRPLLKDGEYTLSVQGKDASGNFSGQEPSLTTFKVINESSISNVLNYPNPFSTSTQFVFTLTGDELPDQMTITIMTISGKVVREITMAEIGPIRSGLNKTEYKWDGTDEFGQKLANGVYLYKMNMRHSSGKQASQFKNVAVDKFFTDGVGKMVILR
jgi:hypothetical protein